MKKEYTNLKLLNKTESEPYHFIEVTLTTTKFFFIKQKKIIRLYKTNEKNSSFYRIDGIEISNEDLNSINRLLIGYYANKALIELLSGADLSGANLRGADLSNSELSGADLRKIDY